jgi:hypothetical protein
VPRKLSRMTRLLTGIGGALCALVVAPSAASAAECPVPVTTQAFAAFGDPNQYVLAPGGDFETLSWAKVGAVTLSYEDDPYRLAPGAFAVDLNRAGEAVVSSSFCVDRTMPHLRFVAKGAEQLDVTVAVTYNGSTDTSSGSISPYEHRWWAPSRFIELRTGSIPAGESATARVTFRSNGRWLIDNVFLDPYRR